MTGLKRSRVDPAPTLGRPCIPRGSAVPHMTHSPRVRARRCPPAACALIGAIARRATVIATSAAACNAPHGSARARARTLRQRSGSRQNSAHKPRTGRRATARVRTSCRDAHASNALRDALTAVRGELGRRSQLCRPGKHLADGTATVVPQRGPRGGRKLRSGVDHRMVEAPESARDDNARRDRIALCGAAAVSAAHHQAYLEEYDTVKLEIVAVRLVQLAQCTCDDGRQPSV